MDGYLRLASTVSAHPELALFRKFGFANYLDLLYRQAEVRLLIAEWSLLVKRVQADGNVVWSDTQFSLEDLVYAERDTLNHAIWSKWQQVRTALTAYGKSSYERERIIAFDVLTSFR